MSRKKKDYGIRVKQPKIVTVYGCANPSVNDGSLCCDGDCSKCGLQTVERTYRKFR